MTDDNNVNNNKIPLSEFFASKAAFEGHLRDGNYPHKTNKNIVDLIYPPGSIYISVSSENPATLFGGTWEKIQGRFLLGSGDGYSLGEIGGSKDAVLIKHNHKVAKAGTHTHETTHDIWNQQTTVSTQSNSVNWDPHGTTKVNGIKASGEHDHSVSTEGTVDSGINKNMPPYTVVHIWKRIE